MTSQFTGRRIAIVGASGQLGKPTLKALLSKGVHTITAVQREESTSHYPDSVIVKKGSFNDESFLVSALFGQDVLVLIVPIPNMDIGDLFIQAAAKAGVPYILPTEFGVDSPEFVNEHSMMAPKVRRRQQIEHLSVSSWIAVITNFWLDPNIQSGLWGIDVKGRRAEIFRGANARVSTSTLSRSAEAIAALLSLGDRDLAQYKNKSYYVSSFELSQRDIFAGVKRMTGTKDKDWCVTEKDADEIVRDCEIKIKSGDAFSEWYRLFVLFFQGINGSNYEGKSVNFREHGLPREDLDTIVKKAIDNM